MPQTTKVTEIMNEDETKRNVNVKKFVEPWQNNQRNVIIRTYNESVHKLVEDETKINNAEYTETEVVEYLNKS